MAMQLPRTASKQASRLAECEDPSELWKALLGQVGGEDLQTAFPLEFWLRSPMKSIFSAQRSTIGLSASLRPDASPGGLLVADEVC